MKGYLTLLFSHPVGGGTTLKLVIINNKTERKKKQIPAKPYILKSPTGNQSQPNSTIT